MHRTTADGFGAGNLFQEGAPGTGLLASKIGAQWLNTLQAELAAIVEAGGLVLDDEDNAQIGAALGLLFSGGNAAAALKNRAINGDFGLWQRGASLAITSPAQFTADRWAANADPSGAGAATISRQAFALGQTNVPGNPLHYLRWQQTTASSGGAPVLFQPFEDVARYSSGTITVSFWARASSSVNVATRAFQVFGAGGSATVPVGAADVALTTTWQRFIATYTLPSVAGKTIGPGSYFRAGLSLPNGSTFTVDVADWQVEMGENASAFDRRPPQLEYLFAARYFEKSYALETAPGAADRSGALAARGFNASSATPDDEQDITSLQERYRVPKRSTPTLLWHAPSGSVAHPASANAASFCSNNPADRVASIAIVSTVGATDHSTGYPRRAATPSGSYASQDFLSGGAVWAHWTADAELL
jgi:hypothetical protein